MSNTKNKQSMAYRNKLKYISRYRKEQMTCILQINPNTEQDLLEWIRSHPNKNGYVRQLILADMKKNNII